MNSLGAIIFLFFCSFASCDEFENLLADSSSTDIECIDLIGSADQTYSFKNSHLALAMRKGFWSCAKELISSAQKSGSDVRNAFDLESRTLMKEIANLKSAIESSLPIASIIPAFQWAQSPTEIFINVKFAHKLDAPATLNVESKNVTVSGNILYLQATDGRKNFVLELELLRDINVDHSTWSMASVGRMVFTLKKDEAPSKWTRLLKSKRKPQNMHSWWELAEKHREELDKLDEDESDEDADEVVVKGKPKKPVGQNTPDVDAPAIPDGAGEETKRTREKTADEAKEELLKNELKTKIQELEDDIRKRKKEIDGKAKADKKELDLEYKEKKAELQKQTDDLLAALESSDLKTEL